MANQIDQQAQQIAQELLARKSIGKKIVLSMESEAVQKAYRELISTPSGRRALGRGVEIVEAKAGRYAPNPEDVINQATIPTQTELKLNMSLPESVRYKSVSEAQASQQRLLDKTKSVTTQPAQLLPPSQSMSMVPETKVQEFVRKVSTIRPDTLATSIDTASRIIQEKVSGPKIDRESMSTIYDYYKKQKIPRYPSGGTYIPQEYEETRLVYKGGKLVEEPLQTLVRGKSLREKAGQVAGVVAQGGLIASTGPFALASYAYRGAKTAITTEIPTEKKVESDLKLQGIEKYNLNKLPEGINKEQAIEYNNQIDENIKQTIQSAKLQRNYGIIEAGLALTPFLFKGYSKLAKEKFIPEAGLKVKEIQRLNQLVKKQEFTSEYYSLRLKALNYLQRKGDDIGVKAINQLFKQPTVSMPTSLVQPFAFGKRLPGERQELFVTTAKDISQTYKLRGERAKLLKGIEVRSATLGLPVVSPLFGEEGIYRTGKSQILGSGEDVVSKSQIQKLQQELEKSIVVSKEGKIPNFTTDTSVRKGSIRYVSPSPKNFVMTESGEVVNIAPKLKPLRGFGVGPLVETYDFIGTSTKKDITKGIGVSFQKSPYTGKLISQKMFLIKSKGNIGEFDILSRTSKGLRISETQQFKVNKPVIKDIILQKGTSQVVIPPTEKLYSRTYKPEYFLPKQRKSIYLTETELSKRLRKIPLGLNKKRIPIFKERISEVISKGEPTLNINYAADINFVPEKKLLTADFASVISSRKPYKIMGISEPGVVQPISRILKPIKLPVASGKKSMALFLKTPKQDILSVSPRIVPKVSGIKISAGTSIPATSLLGIPKMVGGEGRVISRFSGRGIYEVSRGERVREIVFSTTTPVQRLLPTQSTSMISMQKPYEETITLEKTKAGILFDYKPMEISRQPVRELQLPSEKSKEIQLLKQPTQTKSISRGRFKIQQRLRIQEPIREISPPRIRIRLPNYYLEDKRLKKKKSVLFIPEIRRRGKFFSIGKPTSLKEAIKRGTKATRTTLAASFGIREVGTKKRVKLPGILGFKPSKRSEDILIQERRLRLSAPTEVLEIQRARRGRKIFQI